jgi:hypothetical protein
MGRYTFIAAAPAAVHHPEKKGPSLHHSDGERGLGISMVYICPDEVPDDGNNDKHHREQ